MSTWPLSTPSSSPIAGTSRAGVAYESVGKNVVAPSATTGQSAVPSDARNSRTVSWSSTGLELLTAAC